MKTVIQFKADFKIESLDFYSTFTRILARILSLGLLLSIFALGFLVSIFGYFLLVFSKFHVEIKKKM